MSTLLISVSIVGMFCVCLLVYMLSAQKSEIYERMLTIATTDRDAAREECKNLRALLSPRAAKAEEIKPSVQVAKAPVPVETKHSFRKQLRGLMMKHDERAQKLANHAA